MKKILVFLSLLAVPVLSLAQATLLSGTLKNPDGTGFNGQLVMTLAQQSAIASTNGCGGPVFVPSTVAITIKISNGAMISPPHIYGSDCTLPYGVPYNVTARDNNGNVDFTAEWLPMGTIQDIGTIQTVVNPLGTLFGLSLADIALTGAQNTFTQNNTFAQNVTVNGSLTVGGTIFGPVGGSVTVQGTGGSVDFQVLNSVGGQVFIAYDNGYVTIPTPGAALTVAGPIDSNTGYVFQGNGGSTGQCLVSNGAYFVPGACTASIPTIWYQQAAYNDNYIPQRNIVDYHDPVIATDNPAGGRTDVTLQGSIVAPGSYTYPSNVTVDTYGRVTGITAGSLSTQKVQFVTKALGVCTTGSSAFSSCSNAILWPVPFADANYTPVCTAGTPTNQSLTAVWIDYFSVSASGITVWIQNGDASAAHQVSLSSIFCIGIHA